MSGFGQPVRGCGECPFLHGATCAINSDVMIPRDKDGKIMIALPHDCPLWKGSAEVWISLPGGGRA